jgi:redox-sensitive bicupin YhaK (pirin superfamily)
MTAGRGIVHSERTAPDHRAGGEHLHGLQLWVAMPAADEELDPSFHHSDETALPIVVGDGKSVRLILGSLFGERSPVPTLSETVYADATLSPGASLPFDAATDERAIYVVSGEIDIAGDRFSENQMLVLRPGDPITVTAAALARVILLGGAAMDGPRHIWWNFVSSRQERIEQAKAEWKARRFDIVPGDEQEFIPLPES